jgi:hypothetical protein
MVLISKTFSFTSLNLDSWSETYIGARWLIDNVLPEKQYESTPEHGPISQMVLLASHHMIEIILFSSISEALKNKSESNIEIDKNLKKLEKQSFNSAYEYWSPKLLNGKNISKNIEPFISADKLRKRRNATIHKESALTSLEMARSALFTALKASEAIYFHFNETEKYKYDAVVKKYPFQNHSFFSEIVYPEDYYKQKA